MAEPRLMERLNAQDLLMALLVALLVTQLVNSAAAQVAGPASLEPPESHRQGGRC
jgi:hypothetical protein